MMSSLRFTTIAIAALYLCACGSSDSGAGPGGAESGGAPGTGGGAAAGGASGGDTGGGAGNGGASGGANGGASGASPGTGGSGNVGPDGGTGGTSPDGGGSTTPGPCCVASNAKGCTDTTVQDCVCSQDPRCCNEKWNDVCVGLVSGLSCGTTCATNDCCTESAAPGCKDTTVRDCVCAKSPECCSNVWDGFCVQLVTQNVLGGTCGTCPP